MAAARLDGSQGMERTTHWIAREVRPPQLEASFFTGLCRYPRPVHIPTSIVNTGPVSDLSGPVRFCSGPI